MIGHKWYVTEMEMYHLMQNADEELTFLKCTYFDIKIASN